MTDIKAGERIQATIPDRIQVSPSHDGAFMVLQFHKDGWASLRVALDPVAAAGVARLLIEMEPTRAEWAKRAAELPAGGAEVVTLATKKGGP